MPEKRATGIFSEIIVPDGPAKNPAYIGGTSRFIKLLTPKGHHVATLHEIEMPDGTVIHSHVKDYTRRDCSRIGPFI